MRFISNIDQYLTKQIFLFFLKKNEKVIFFSCYHFCLCHVTWQAHSHLYANLVVKFYPIRTRLEETKQVVKRSSSTTQTSFIKLNP